MRKPLETPGSRKSSDNEQLVSFLNGVEANPYLDAFYGVLSQVLDTPYQRTFFNVLQHLRDIHLLRHPSGNEYVWEILEKFVCRLKQLRSPNEAHELLIQLSYECGRSVSGAFGSSSMIHSTDSFGCCCSCHRGSTSPDGTAPTVAQPPSPPPLPPSNVSQPTATVGDQKKQSSSGQSSSSTSSQSTDSRRPTFAEIISNAAATASQRSTIADGSIPRRNAESYSNRSAAAPAPPVRMPPPPPPVTVDEPITASAKLLPQQNLPQPKTKLKTLPWSKVPTSKIVESKNNGDNVWMKASRRFDTGAIIKSINFDDLETLFAAQTASPPNTMERRKSNDSAGSPSTPTAPVASNKQNNDSSSFNGGDGFGTLGRRRDASSDVNLLDPKRSLNVNIFLKQFRGGIEDLIELIATGDSHYLGLEKLRGLMKILPEPDELETLKAYVGDKSKLGNAERFFLALCNMSDYRLRVESMLLKEEFLSMVDYMKPSISTLITAARDLKNAQSLQEVLYLVLLVGNYLNAGGYGGNAAGFKMTSLWKLVEIRANKPNVTLLHYVVAEIEKRNTRLLELPKELKHLDEASKLSFDTILSDFRHLKDKTERVSKQVAQTNAEDEIRHQTEVFFEFAKSELITIERDVAQVERLRLELAEFFCEDVQTFKLEECFKIFSTFCQRFARAIDENVERRLQEEKAELRRRLREQQKAKKDYLLTQRASFCEADSSRRLSDKYKSLLNTGDVILSYESGYSGRPDASQRHGRTNLVDLLTTTSSNATLPNPRRSISGEEDLLDADFNSGFASWRRSYNCKRRSAHCITSSTFTNRERPQERDTKPWRQRFEGLLDENERTPNQNACSASSSELDTICDMKQTYYANAPSTYATNVDKPVECSPIFARTFQRRDCSRTSSINNLEQCESPAQSLDCQELNMKPVELRRSVWREQRRIRAASLLADVGENNSGSTNDLNELLEIMKIENESNAASRRRGSKFRSVTSETDDDEANEKCAGLALSDADRGKTDIDEVVRHCEQARQEIDSIGQPVVTSPSQLLPSSCANTISTNQSGSVEECSVDFALSVADNRKSCNLVISCGSDAQNSASSSTSPDRVDSVKFSTVAPSSEMLDEGFEEENSTNCSSVAGVQSPPLLSSSPKRNSSQQQRGRTSPTSNPSTTKAVARPRSNHPPTKALSTTASQTRFSYQSGTKSSSMKMNQTASPKPAATALRRSSANSDQSSVRSRPAISSKITVDKSTSLSKKTSNVAESAKATEIRSQAKLCASQKMPIKNSAKTIVPTKSASQVKSMTPGPIAKTRIQSVPLRPSLKAQRMSASVGATSSSSGSDSEQQSIKNPPIRRRLPVCRSGEYKKEAPLQKSATTNGNARNQHTSVLTVAPRLAASNFRHLAVRKLT